MMGMSFLQNLGLGRKSPTMTAESVGAVGPGMADMTEASSIGYDPYDPQFGAVGPRKKEKKKGLKEMLAGVGALGQQPDIYQGMPAQQPFRLTGGLMGRF